MDRKGLSDESICDADVTLGHNLFVAAVSLLLYCFLLYGMQGSHSLPRASPIR